MQYMNADIRAQLYLRSGVKVRRRLGHELGGSLTGGPGQISVPLLHQHRQYRSDELWPRIARFLRKSSSARCSRQARPAVPLPLHRR